MFFSPTQLSSPSSSSAASLGDKKFYRIIFFVPNPWLVEESIALRQIFVLLWFSIDSANMGTAAVIIRDGCTGVEAVSFLSTLSLMDG